ncbi:MAG: glycoside hydrolase family 26 protein [Chthoniobacterales bacterium]
MLLQTLMLSAAAAPYKTLSIPTQGAYTGAYVDFGEGEDHVTLETIENFEHLVGKHQAIIGSSSFWARQNFPTDQINLIRSYGAVPLIYWSPWDAPFDQDRGPDRFSLDKILDGTWDHYIDAWADAAKALPEQFFVSFGCEMNGTWFPWSGTFYGKGKSLSSDKKSKSPPWAGPEKFKKAYRYVVDRVRARGANNVLWVFHVNNYSYPNTPWNLAAAYYPGPSYVDWLGMSLYGKQYADEDWATFKPLLDWPYKELCKLDPNKPIMLAEWGVAEPHGAGDKGAWFSEGFRAISSGDYPRLKAAVIWHERWQNEDGTFSNLRVNSSQSALKGYREGVANPFWIDRPEWEKI